MLVIASISNCDVRNCDENLVTIISLGHHLHWRDTAIHFKGLRPASSINRNACGDGIPPNSFASDIWINLILTCSSSQSTDWRIIRTRSRESAGIRSDNSGYTRGAGRNFGGRGLTNLIEITPILTLIIWMIAGGTKEKRTTVGFQLNLKRFCWKGRTISPTFSNVKPSIRQQLSLMATSFVRWLELNLKTVK